MKCISQDWFEWLKGSWSTTATTGMHMDHFFALKSFCAWESKTWRCNPCLIHVILLIDGSFSQSHTTQSVRQQFQTYSLPVCSFAHTAMTSLQLRDSWPPFSNVRVTSCHQMILTPPPMMVGLTRVPLTGFLDGNAKDSRCNGELDDGKLLEKMIRIPSQTTEQMDIWSYANVLHCPGNLASCLKSCF